jgi:hypothetical protein
MNFYKPSIASDGRLITGKDQNGKILKQIDYQYQVSLTR